MNNARIIGAIILSTIGLSACAPQTQIPGQWSQNAGEYNSTLHHGIDERRFFFYQKDPAREKFYNTIYKHRNQDIMIYTNPPNSIMTQNPELYKKWFTDRQNLTEDMWGGAKIIAPEAAAKAMLAYLDETAAIIQTQNIESVDNIANTVDEASKKLHEEETKINEQRNTNTLASVAPIQYPVSGGGLNREQAYIMRNIIKNIRDGDVYHTILIQGTDNPELYRRRAESLKSHMMAIGVPKNRITISNIQETEKSAQQKLINNDSDIPGYTWITIAPYQKNNTNTYAKQNPNAVPVF